MWSVGWPSLTASAMNSSEEKCTPTVTCSCPSLTSPALATYPCFGVLRTRVGGKWCARADVFVVVY